MIEVESKFLFTDVATAEKLIRAGAHFIGEKRFIDKYYDTKDFHLTLSDHWLRQRNDSWQLKYPAKHEPRLPDSRDASFLLSTLYAEAETEPDILSALRTMHVNNLSETCLFDLKMRGGSVEMFLAENQCFVFAEISTVRLSYVLDGVNIDLDMTGTGYRVGELEVMVDRASDIDCARNTINELAAKIGFTAADRVPGKMEVHLEEFHPEHYERLKRLQIFA